MPVTGSRTVAVTVTVVAGSKVAGSTTLFCCSMASKHCALGAGNVPITLTSFVILVVLMMAVREGG